MLEWLDEWSVTNNVFNMCFQFIIRPGAYNMDVISDDSTESSDNVEGHVALRNTPDAVQFSAGLVLT